MLLTERYVNHLIRKQRELFQIKIVKGQFTRVYVCKVKEKILQNSIVFYTFTSEISNEYSERGVESNYTHNF